MAGRYDHREIWDVDIQIASFIAEAKSENAAEAISANVQVSLKALHGNMGGPTVRLAVVLDPMPGATLPEIERAALDATHEMLSRFAAEDGAALVRLREAGLRRDMEPLKFDLDLDP